MNTNCNTAKFIRPASSVIERGDGFLIEAELPGARREGIQLTVEDDTLTITAQRQTTPAGVRPLHRESTALDYRREFVLGEGIDRGRVNARFEQGVLQVFLPKAEAIKPRRIEIAG